MISEKDVQILSMMRRDARRRVTNISRQMKMPVTTLYDRIRSHTKNGIVKRYVTLLDFRKLGYNATSLVAFKADIASRQQLYEYLRSHPNVNSLYRVNREHDFVAEVVFENLARLQEFLEETEKNFALQNTKVFNIVEEIRKEDFLTKT